jgi:8-oxo-dGTP diphosphatase
MHPLEVGAALIYRDGQYLITQRKAEDSFGGFWELPGGKREPDEPMEDCVRRELKEELDLDVTILGFFRIVVYPYPHRLVKLHIYWCSIAPEAVPKAIECQAYAWVDPKDLANYTFPEADQELIQELTQKPAGKESFPRLHDYPDEYLEFMRLFNRGFYFESHELLEELWHPSEGKDRLHYQALIQMAVALRHVQHHNWPGALGLYTKAKDKWAELPDQYKGLDLKALKESLDPLFDQIKKAVDEGKTPVDLPAIPKMPLPI